MSGAGLIVFCLFFSLLSASIVFAGGWGWGGGWGESQKALRKKRVWKCTPTGGKIPGGAN